MSYTALYRKWRPLVFEDVVEQEQVVKTIKNTVKSQRIAHAYLFCGTRGTGKTTMAKIFARAINCLNPIDGDPCNECEICKGILSDSVLDVIEIDAASNNSVDNIREIRDEVVYAPSQAKYKVYIIDEVHMLSTGAFNALLKTLEEPPPHVVFILATTDPHKLPATILSRCQRFDFKKITSGSIAERIMLVANASQVQLENDAALLIARLADGAMRDALSILDQCIAVGEKTITHQNVLDIIGIVSDDFISDIVDYIKENNISGLVDAVEKLSSSGRDILKFASDLVMYFRDLLVCKLSKKAEDILDVSRQHAEKKLQQSEAFSKEQIVGIIKELSSFEPQLKYALNQRVFLEVMLISISSGSYGQSSDNSALLDRIVDLENSIKAGITVNKVPQAQESPKAAALSGSTAMQGKAGNAGKDNINKYMNRRLELWSDVISELKASGRMKLFSYMDSTWAMVRDDCTVVIVFPPEKASCTDCISKEDKGFLEEILSGKLSRQMRAKFEKEEDLQDIIGDQKTSDVKDSLEAFGEISQYLDIKDE
jgi:DNA polymerase-3 subunit gamma/tau